MTYQLAQDEDYLKVREFRCVDNLLFDLYLRFSIKGKYVRMSCAHKKESWGLVIRSSALAKSLLSIYELNWQQGTDITKQMVKSWGKNKILKSQLKKGYLNLDKK